MKAPNVKQMGFFDPVTGLILFGIFSLTAVVVDSVNSTDSVDTIETQYQVACIEPDATIVREGFHCN